MSGSLRFESTSASSEELGYSNSGYSNGQKGNYVGSSLGRSGSFRESNESRVFGSGTVSRGHAAGMVGELPPLLECLKLEQFSLCDYKVNRSVEVKRVLGFSYGSVTDEDPVRGKSPPPVAQEDLKRFKASIVDTTMKARGRTRKLIESLQILNKYYDAINSQKYQRNESLPNEKSGVPLLPKTGAQMQRNLQEDKSKNVNMNKRVRTAVADSRSEGRNNAPPRQNMLLGKDKGALNVRSPSSDIPNEKIRQLPSGGEGWDRKMKRKRSTGTVLIKNSVDDLGLKRSMTVKLDSESTLQSCDPQASRYGSLGGTTSMKHGSFAVSANARAMVKNEPENVSLLKDATSGPCKEKVVTKGNNNKVGIHEDNISTGSAAVMKGKNTRAPRTYPATAACSSPNIPRLSGATDGWEQPSSTTKFQTVNGNNSRKRPIVSGSSTAPMAQWVGQRPQKIQRNRRANLVSPVTNRDDMQTSSEDCSLDTVGRQNPSATTGSAHMKGASNSVKQTKVETEHVSSPGLLSESEESRAGDNSLEEGGKYDANLDGNFINGGQQTVSSLQPMNKNKMHFREECGDGVRRQGRSGRGSQPLRSNTSPINERLESTTKPGRNSRPGHDKSGSKSGRPPVKKSSDRSKFTRLGQLPNGGSPDRNGDSDDDHEELLGVAECVRNLSSVTCTNTFWKQMERYFKSVRSGDEDAPYLEQELKSSEQLHAIARQMSHCNGSILVNDLQDKVYESDETETNVPCNVVSVITADVIDKHQDKNGFKGNFKEFPPLYQRLLSALIVEDELVEFNEAFGDSDGPLQSMCNGNIPYDQGTGTHYNGNQFHDCDAMCTATANNIGHINITGMPLMNCPYDQMHLEERLLLELHSIGLYLETMSELSEDEEPLDKKIFAVKKGLDDLVDKKRLHLRKACGAMQYEMEQEGRHLEQHAMDRLVEVAFRKLLASRGSSSSKSASAKISRQIAMVFVKRTLRRCRNFEASGKSCFGDPPMREILAARSCINVSDPSNIGRSGAVPSGGDLYGSVETPSDLAFGRNNPMFNKGKKKEVLLDDVGATTLRGCSALGSQLLGGAKGKRCERDSLAKNGRLSLEGTNGKLQPKSKPRQTSSLHPTSAFPIRNIGNGLAETASAKLKLNSNGQMDMSNLPLQDLDSIEDLGVGTSLGEHQDFDTWFNFDDDAIPEHDAFDMMDLSGLEIPMDDLSELNMF